MAFLVAYLPFVCFNKFCSIKKSPLVLYSCFVGEWYKFALSSGGLSDMAYEYGCLLFVVVSIPEK